MPAASFNVVNATTITAVLGAGASGDITVTNAYGSYTVGNFLFKYPPTLTSFSPALAGNGSVVTVTGTGFEPGGTWGPTNISFGGVAATSVTWISPTTVTAVVGSGASGNVTVTTNYGIANLPGFTWVTAPTISSFAPTSASAGMTVTITGTNLNNTSSVSFGGAPASSLTVVSNTTVTAVVGLGSTGSVSLTTPGGTTSLAGFSYLLSASAPDWMKGILQFPKKDSLQVG